jgi:cytidine deaminase
MTAGNEIREKMKNGEAMASLGIWQIENERLKNSGFPVVPPKTGSRSLRILVRGLPIPNNAYVLRSLKHPDEERLLRQVYGPSFYLIGCYSPRERRLQNLSTEIAESYNSSRPEKFHAKAEQLLNRDEEEEGKYLGQNVRSDVFVDASNPVELEKSLTRFVELIFGCGIHTPNKDEYAMFLARGASVRSADLSRQVGASIATTEGDIVSIGCNEVPKFGGGQYWSDDPDDYRDYRMGYSVSDKMRKNLLADAIRRLSKTKWLVPPKGLSVDEIVDRVIPRMEDSQIMDLIEFGRAIHAEMSAILSAAHSGVSVDGCTLYSTTFPCHDCARHIVGAGISRVFYIEPYPKSRTAQLHSDSVAVDSPGSNADRVDFVPFVGIAPRKYMPLFSMLKRKRANGDVLLRSKPSATPRFVRKSFYYVTEEFGALSRFSRLSENL